MTGPQLLNGGCLERGGWPFNRGEGGAIWSNIFFSVRTKNSNWEISTKNLATFKREDGIKDEKLWYFRGSLKNPTFFGGGGVGVGVTKKYREELLKRRLRQFSDLRGAWQEIEGVRFLRGDWYPNALYDNLESVS